MLILPPRDEALLLRLRELILCAPFVAWFYYLVSALCAERFFRRPRAPETGFTPPVSILKPVRGIDREAYENFSSFCQLDYPDYEILFGVSDPADPVIPIVERLIRDFPERSIRLFTGFGKLGHNDKASVLAHLAREATHDLVVSSDSDTRADRDYLRVIAAPFRDPQVGAVTCLYRGEKAETLADRLEAVSISSDFFASVLLFEQFAGARFALGATMATTRERLAGIGGFEVLSEFLLDDYELGRRIAGQGYRIELLPYTVSMVLPSETLAGFWHRQLRWSVGVRNSRPWSHAALLLTQGLPLSLAAMAVSRSTLDAGFYLAAYLITRYTLAWTVGISGLKDTVLRKAWWLVPARDAAAFCIWLASLRYSRVNWRGDAFYVRKGRLVPAGAAPEQ